MAGLPKILIVEDNIEILELYLLTLKGNGYEVKSASNVDDALSIAKSFHPDIIFLDIMLPGNKTGLDALMILRTDSSYGCTKKRIVMLTNLGMNDKIRNEWEEYADGYVIKAEIVPHDLIEIINSFESSTTPENQTDPNSTDS